MNPVNKSFLPQQAEHASLWEYVDLTIQHQRVPQSLLLIGPQYIGVSEFAFRLAALLLCASEHKPCGLCESCHLLSVSNHPDFQVIRPEAEGGVVKIDQVRGLQDNVYQTPKCSATKVIVIEQADKMNRAAANALLKVLEEPPTATYFILVAEKLHSIPVTILSRCQRLIFPDKGHDFFNYLALGQHYPAASNRAVLYLNYESFVTSLGDLVDGKVSPCTIAAQWKDYALVDLIWLLYLILAQALQLQLVTNERALLKKDAIARFANLLNPVIILQQMDLMNSMSKKLSHNIAINATLALENILIGFLRK